MLKLPKLSSRFPTDAIGREKSKGKDKDGDGSGSSGGGPSLLSRKVRRVFEHKPAELRIVVNGFLQGSLKTSGELNELKLNLSESEKIEFIEVFSEQQVRLLILSVDEQPPHGRHSHSASLSLSDRRTIGLTLNFGADGAELHLVYEDPTFGQVAAMLANPGLLEIEEQGPRQSGHDGGISIPTLARWRDLLRNFSLSPKLAAAALTLAAVAGILGFSLIGRSVSASEILKRSEAAEMKLGRITHRKVTVTTTSLNPKRDFEVRSLEEWNDPAEGTRVTRVFNEAGELYLIVRVSGKVVTTYTSDLVRPMAPLNPKVPPQLEKMLKTWQHGLTAREFKALIGDVDKASLDERPESYLIRYSESDEPITAALLLEKSSLRPVTLNLRFQINGRPHSYDFTETSFESFSPGSVDPRNFSIDAGYHELTSRAVE